MSVLIKNMKMPENCIMCPFAERVPPGRTRCLRTDFLLMDTTHHRQSGMSFVHLSNSRIRRYTATRSNIL